MSDINRNEKMRELLLKLSSATDEELEKFLNQFEAKDIKPVYEESFERKLSESFRLLGVPYHLKGYKFLKDACICVNENPELIFGGVTKEVYPYVAKINDTTASRVERAMRHALEVAWDRGDPETQKEIFGYTCAHHRGNPTNSEFIAAIAEYYK